jgi:hypothetical protein
VTAPHFVFAAIGVGEITSATRHDGISAMLMCLIGNTPILLSIIVQKYL